MSCSYHSEPGSIRPELTEEVIMNDDLLPGGMEGWRRFRIEYGFECACPEGLIYLPPHVDPDIIEDLLQIMAEEEPESELVKWEDL